MDIEICRLTPERVEDYLGFFDHTPHNQKRGGVKCYCVYWCGDESDDQDFKTKGARRAYAAGCVRQGKIQGYLAYANGEVVGWCNANTKAHCLKCAGFKGMNGKRKGFIPTDEPGIRVKSIFCFAVAPEMQRRGIASKLLERVCEDAALEGFDFAEAYPDKVVTDKTEDFTGYVAMYEKSGFEVYGETARKLVLRKPLK